MNINSFFIKIFQKSVLGLSKNKIVLFLILIILFFVGLYLFETRSLKPVISETELVFHPDSVIAFEWQSPSGKKMSFHRKSRNSDWINDENPLANNLNLQIQKKLILLAQKQSVSNTKAIQGKTQFKLTFSDQQTWLGRANHSKISWKLPSSFQTYELTPDQQNIFLEGDYVFDDLTWNWCQQRPQKIQTNFGDGEIILELKKLDWILTSNKGVQSIDATTVERWLSHQCQLKFTRFFDKKISNPFSFFSKHQFQVTWADGQQSSYSIQDNMIEIAEDKIGFMQDPVSFKNIFSK